jgi:hypothetical protein
MILAASGALILVYLIVVIFYIAVNWIIYQKADQPGWACIIPFYNVIVLLRIIGRPWWWLILLFIPFVDIVIIIIMDLDLAKSFRKGTGFGIGLIFLSFIFLPILAFGSAEYAGPAGLRD